MNFQRFGQLPYSPNVFWNSQTSNTPSATMAAPKDRNFSGGKSLAMAIIF